MINLLLVEVESGYQFHWVQDPVPRSDRCIIRTVLAVREEESVAIERVSIVFHNLRHGHCKKVQ